MEIEAVELAAVRALTSSGEAQRIREDAQLSFGDIARSCGVQPSTVMRWERGQRQPRGQAALKYGAVLESLRRSATKSERP